MHLALHILRHHPCDQDQYMTHGGKFVVPLAARPAPKNVPATLLFYIYHWTLRNHPCDPYMTLVRQCGTPSCATSAQERTGYIVVLHLSLNIDKPISPGFKDDTCETMWYPQLCNKRPRAYRLQLPSAAHSRAQKHSHVNGTLRCETSAHEHTGYIALPSAARSEAQKHSHVMVPLAARQAPKSVPVTSWTPTFTQLCTRQSGAACPLTFSSPRHPVYCLCQPCTVTHTRQEWITIWSGRNWILKHAD